MKKSKIIINNDIELINYLKEICEIIFNGEFTENLTFDFADINKTIKFDIQ